MLLHKTHLSHLSQDLGDKKNTRYDGETENCATALSQVTTLLYPERSMALKVPLLIQGLIKSTPIGPSVAPGPLHLLPPWMMGRSPPSLL